VLNHSNVTLDGRRYLIVHLSDFNLNVTLTRTPRRTCKAYLKLQQHRQCLCVKRHLVSEQNIRLERLAMRWVIGQTLVDEGTLPWFTTASHALDSNPVQHSRIVVTTARTCGNLKRDNYYGCLMKCGRRIHLLDSRQKFILLQFKYCGMLRPVDC